ncbi:MAG: hypothetical protein NVSMB4_18710 [Acidimicrobiales bacterium]
MDPAGSPTVVLLRISRSPSGIGLPEGANMAEWRIMVGRPIGTITLASALASS